MPIYGVGYAFFTKNSSTSYHRAKETYLLFTVRPKSDKLVIV